MAKTAARLLLVVLLALPLPAFAADLEVLAFGTHTTPRGSNVFGDSRVRVANDNGYGAGVNLIWSRWLTAELAASVARPEVNATVSASGPQISFGTLRMMPLSATVQLHPLHDSLLDPYIGGGAAYVRFSRLRSAALSGVNVDAISFDSHTAPVANAGLSIHLTRAVGLLLDAKYIPMKSRGRVGFRDAPSESLELRLNPYIFSAGLRFHL